MKRNRIDTYCIPAPFGPIPSACTGYKIAAAMIIACTVFLLSTVHALAMEKDRILLLNSYSYDHKWTRSITEAVIDIISQKSDAEFIVEFMDTKRHSSAEHYRTLLALYKQKYSATDFDLVITSDDNAVNFALANRKELFPDTPIVFCGVNNLELPERKDFINITGALEKPGIAETIALMGDVLPKAENLYIINESSTFAGEKDREAIHSLQDRFSKRFRITWLEDMQAEDIEATLKRAPSNSAVLLLSFFMKKQGGTFTIDEGANFISTASPHPVFSMWEYFLGEGIVGGLLTSGKYHGITAARMGLRILDGERPEDIQILSTDANKFMFDYNQLHRHGIDIAMLPEDSILINEPTSIFYQYRTQLLFGLGLIASLTVLCIYLASTIVEKRKVEKQLAKANKELGDLVEVRNKEISRLRRTEEALRAKRDLQIGLFDNLPVGVSLWDANGDYLQTNKVFVDIVGYTREDIPTTDAWFRKAYPDPRFRDHVYAIWLLEKKKKQAVKQFKTTTKAGDEKDIEYRTCKLPDGRILVTLQDVTENNQRQQMLLRAKEEAVQANHAKSEFLANMSHELRTPLNGIIGMLSCLKLTELTDQQYDFTDKALTSTQRLTTLMSNILSLSRIEAGQMELHVQNFDPREVLHAVEGLYASLLDEKNLSFNLHIDESIPSSVTGDDVRLQQILVNLVGNAVKFTENGTVTLEAIALSPLIFEHPRILFSISDTGMGISEDKIDGLYESFSQVHEGFTRQHQGAGLGLAIVRKLVFLMRGNMSVVSEPGVGTTFHVSLPFEFTETNSALAAPTQQQNKAENLHILVAEDDIISQYAMVMQLEKAGYTVKVVENGQRALEALRKEQFDLVFMDIQMPEMDGVTATRAIRSGQSGSQNSQIPIIAMTAYAMEGDKDKFMQSGMDYYLAKPINNDSILHAVDQVLNIS